MLLLSMIHRNKWEGAEVKRTSHDERGYIVWYISHSNTTRQAFFHRQC